VLPAVELLRSQFAVEKKNPNFYCAKKGGPEEISSIKRRCSCTEGGGKVGKKGGNGDGVGVDLMRLAEGKSYRHVRSQ